MPSTIEAVKVFQDAKILHAPGKASNAGGVATSGLEMCQNSMRLSWTREEVDAKLKQIMKDIHDNCVTELRMAELTMLGGANIAGFVQFANAMLCSGSGLIQPLTA